MLETVAKGISLLGTVLTGVSKATAVEQSAVSTAQQAAYEANILRANRAIAEASAVDALERGMLASRESEIKTGQNIGQIRADLASAGIVVDQDSALDIVAQTAGVGALDALTILANAEREAEALRTEGLQFERRAMLREAAGADVKAAGKTDKRLTLLGTATAVADKWYGYTT